MGITLGFLAKHVRPYDVQAYEAMATNVLLDVLLKTLGQNDTIALLNRWYLCAKADGAQVSLVNAARDVTDARWSTLIPTNVNTVMFFRAKHVTYLSEYAEKNKSKNITVDFGAADCGNLPVAVNFTQTKVPNIWQSHVRWEVGGFEGASDANGFCCHFSGLT